jgi:hypothetical protein
MPGSRSNVRDGIGYRCIGDSRLAPVWDLKGLAMNSPLPDTPDARDPEDYASTLPARPIRHVVRDDLLGAIDAAFDAGPEALLVRWPTGAGKSTLLSDFVRAKPRRCICFFIGSDVWLSSRPLFLFDLCQQLSAVLGTPEVSPETDFERLKDLFARLYGKLLTRSRRTSQRYFLVIDGLDQARADETGKRILDLIPVHRSANVRLLLSSASDSQDALPDLEREVLTFPYFGVLQIRDLLRELPLNDDQIEQIRRVTAGFPAFVAEVGRQLRSGRPVDEVLATLPPTMGDLLDREWRRTVKDEDTRLALAVIAYAPQLLGLEDWAAITSLATEFLTGLCAGLPFLTAVGPRGIDFASGVHRQFVHERVARYRAQAEVRLVDHYMADPYSPEAIQLLPGLLRQARNFETLKSLVDVSYLSRTVKATHDLSVVVRGLGAASEAALAGDDVPAAVFYAGASALVASSYRRFDSSRGEIEALCAVGEVDEALSVARSAVLPADQLQALGAVARGMRGSGIVVPDTIRHEIGFLADQVPQSTPPIGVGSIAASFFDTAPEDALRLVERCVGRSGERALDNALVAMSLESDKSTPVEALQLLRDKVRDRDLVGVLGFGPFGGSLLTASEVVDEATRLADPSARLFMLRSWCQRNRDNAAASVVVDRALHEIEEEASFVPSLRAVRQLMEPLRACSTDEARGLVARLERARGGSGFPNGPERERIRLDLLVAEQMHRWSSDDAVTSLGRVRHELDEAKDLDIRALGLAHLVAVCSRIREERLETTRADALSALQSTFLELLADSADQLGITRPILLTVVRFDASLAIQMADCLNTVERRDRAKWAVVSARSKAAEGPFDPIWALDVCSDITDALEMRGPAISDVCEAIALRGIVIAPFEDRLRAAIDSLPDPSDRASCHAWMAVRFADGAATSSWSPFDDAVRACGSIDEPWRREGVTYELVPVFRRVSEELACRFLGTFRNEGTSPGNDRFYGPLLAQCLQTLIATIVADASRDDLYKQLEQIDQFVAAIESRSTQAGLLASVASRLYLSGIDDRAGELTRRLIGLVDGIPDEYSGCYAFVRAAYAIGCYDFSGLAARLASAPRAIRNEAIEVACIQVVTGQPWDVPIDAQRLRTSVGPRQVDMVLRLVELADRDATIVATLRLLASAALDSADPQLAKRQISILADRISTLLTQHLPDPAGITHPGWQLVGQAQVLRLRQKVNKAPLTEAWSDLANQVATLRNAADRAIVATWIAEDIGRVPVGVADRFLVVAQSACKEIPDGHDRVTRFDALADAYLATSDASHAEDAIRAAFANLVDVGESADHLLDSVLETADAINPELASHLTTLIDDRVRLFSVEDRTAARQLQKKPDTVMVPADDTDLRVHQVGVAAGLLRRSLASGRGQAQSRQVVAAWLREAGRSDYESAQPVLCWAAENARVGNWSLKTRAETHKAAASVFEFGWNLADTLIARGTEEPVTLAYEAYERVGLFRAGETRIARAALRDWIEENAIGYLLIQDPYFKPEDLILVGAVPAGLRVRILASMWEQKRPAGGQTDPSELRGFYNAAWRRLFDFIPPPTTISMLGTKSKKCPLHDRFILSADGRGLSIGTSFGGIGNKDTSFIVLEPGQVLALERRAAGLLAHIAPVHDGEPLLVETFELDG